MQILHMASLIKIYLNTIKFEDQLKARQKVEDAKALLRQLINDLKLLSVSLNSDRVAQLGIVKGLETEIERLKKTDQLEVTFIQKDQPPEMDNDTTIILYRMAQEIINNMMKHSKAKRIGIVLEVKGNLLI